MIICEKPIKEKELYPGLSLSVRLCVVSELLRLRIMRENIRSLETKTPPGCLGSWEEEVEPITDKDATPFLWKLSMKGKRNIKR